MKGQLIPVVFIVLLVFGVIVGYVFYNIFYGTEYQLQVFRTHTIDIVRNLIEQFKNYLKLSLIYSSHQSLREHACLGGLIPAGDWICNGPSPVNVGQSKNCLEKHTKYYLNMYTGLFNTSLPVELTSSGFSTCVYEVDGGGVLSGEYDEGDFWVKCSEAKIAVSGKNIKEFEKSETNSFITKNRYWYMFRIFHEWANADVYSPCVCGCTLACAGCGCTKQCARKAYEDLQARFDEYVVCYIPEIRCCDQEFGGISCSPGNRCLPWSDTDCKCVGDDCSNPPIGEVCLPEEQNNLNTMSQSHESEQQNIFSNEQDCSCDYWVENKLAARYLFVCDDHKYYVPTSKGPLPLKFKAYATAAWRAPDACLNKASCECSSDLENCTDCICPPCPNPCY